MIFRVDEYVVISEAPIAAIRNPLPLVVMDSVFEVPASPGMTNI